MNNEKTSTEILEGNKLIAEFMKQSFSADSFKASNRVPKLSELKYHTSWDWLMPVVEKIENLDYWFQIKRNHVLIEYFGNDYEAKEKGLYFLNAKQFGKNKISITYSVVIDFIKWYNAKK